MRLIRKIHAELMQGVRGGRLQPGELRASQSWIGPAGCSLATATFVPPPPHEVPQALADLERFLHDGGGLPLLVQVGLAHAQFETIHPFLDGNGRIGRLLIAFLLTEKRLLAKPMLYLSHYFKQRRAEYYERLQAVRDAGDWEGWLAFFLDGVTEVSQQATYTAAAILRMRDDYRARITERLGRAAANGQRVMNGLALRSPHCDSRHRARMARPYARRREPDRQPAQSHRPAVRDHRLCPQPALPLRAASETV